MKKLVKIFCFLIGLMPIAQSEFIYRITQIQCAASGKSAKFLFCYPKTYDRKVFTMNVGIEILRSMNPMMLDFSVQRENSAGIFENLHTSRNSINWCESKKHESENKFFGLFSEEVRSSTANVFYDICSKTGPVIANNITFSGSSVLSMWPDGDYRISVEFHDDEDEKIMNVTYTARFIHK